LIAAEEKGKHAWLLKDEGVKRWLKNVERGSPITAEVSHRRLGRACDLMGTTPRKMVVQAKRNIRRFQDELEDLVSELEADKKAPMYISGILKAVRSWLNYNDINLTRRIKITNPSATPTIEDEQVPSQEELARIFRQSPSRIRLAEALMAFADLRPETLGNYNGSDGLEMKDLPEVRISPETKQVQFDVIPTRVNVRANLSKTGCKYFTFLGSEGCSYLKEELEARMRAGEELGLASPVIGFDRPPIKGMPHMQTRKITDQIRDCMREAGVYKRPYVLRAYAETQLIIAESKGKISHPYLQFIAGHKGDIEARYSTNKGSLPPDMIEGMRAAYKDCEPFLSTTMTDLAQSSSIIKEAKIEALKSVAKSMFGVDLLDIKIAKENEYKKQLSHDETIELFEVEIRKQWDRPPSPTQTIIADENELPELLRQGWQFVSVLSGTKVIIRK
jgi:hypothetical protein